MVEDYNKESMYWRSVLTRVVATIKFLAARGLPIFGENKTIGSVANGNFLGCLELLGQFDPFIANHIEKFGNTNYPSSTVASGILQLMSNKVLQHILFEINEAKYFGLIVDSTPDLSHIDQLSIVIRYVNKEGLPIERFLKFVPIFRHSASTLESTVINELQCFNIDILNCRGQSYDNASNMAGKYSSLQARIKVICPQAECVPCSAHSLNLVGSNAVQCCTQAVVYFGVVQNIYNFFSASTHRWQKLQELLNPRDKLNVKSLSATRWSAEADAVRALHKNHIAIKQVLFSIANNVNETATSRHEAKSLH